MKNYNFLIKNLLLEQTSQQQTQQSGKQKTQQSGKQQTQQSEEQPKEQETSANNILKDLLRYTDLNSQINVESKKNELLNLIKEKLKDENSERSQSRENKLEINPEEVYIKLKNKITEAFKPSRGDRYYDINNKLIWLYILADPNQNINLQTK